MFDKRSQFDKPEKLLLYKVTKFVSVVLRFFLWKQEVKAFVVQATNFAVQSKTKMKSTIKSTILLALLVSHGTKSICLVIVLFS